MRRHFFVRHCWWSALAFIVLLGIPALASGLQDKGTVFSGIVAVALGFCYFSQQQKLAEVTIFKQLFTEFNARYNSANEQLATITDSIDTLTPELRQVIVNYINLCAEEFLFRSEGCIPDEVWCSWCRGMLEYIEKEPFRSVWEAECSKSCYYGLTRQVIVEGAGLPNLALQQPSLAAAPAGQAKAPLGEPVR